jgi:hypothetical protein
VAGGFKTQASSGASDDGDFTGAVSIGEWEVVEVVRQRLQT